MDGDRWAPGNRDRMTINKEKRQRDRRNERENRFTIGEGMEGITKMCVLLTFFFLFAIAVYTS
jgi:hypothetical protein